MGTQSSTGSGPEATQVAGTAEESVEGLAVPPATEQNERDNLERDTVPDDTHFEVAQGVREPNEQPVSSSVSGYECESSSVDNLVNAEKERPIRPKWMVSKCTKKAGRVKVTVASRKTALNTCLKQTSLMVQAVGLGLEPSVGFLVEAVQSGVTYKHAVALRALTILQQNRKAKTTVFERRNKPETNPYTLRTVLPLRRIETGEAQVAQFQNRWYSDLETRMPQTGELCRQ
ncbi:hypothetical protein F444_22254, partial [Phytophthora nicotianae P1976]